MQTIKLNLNHFFSFLFCVSFFNSSILLASDFLNHKVSDELEIIENEQVISFFLDSKTDELKATLKVVQVYETQSEKPVKVIQAFTIDDYSELKSIWIKKKNRKRTVKPIITDYELDGIFHNDLKLYLKEYTIRKGERLEIGYEKIFHDTRFLNALYFSQSHTVQSSLIKLKIPKWLQLKVEKINFENAKINSYNLTQKNTEIFVFEQEDLLEISSAKGKPSRQKTDPHLILIPNSYLVDGKKKLGVSSVNDLYNWYYSLVGQVNNDPKVLDELVTNLIAGKVDDMEKIQAIYYWVQENIRYIAFEDGINGFKPEDCQSVFYNKYGDCKGMANLTKQMLRLAGYDARLTWMGTRDIPYSYDIPSLLVDNHMICTVIWKEEKLFLDPTQKFTGIKEYGYHIQGQEVLIEDGENFIRDRIPYAKLGNYALKSNYELSLKEGQLIGKGNTIYNGSSRIQLANYLSGIETGKRKEFMAYFLSNDNKNVDIHNINLPDWKVRDQALQLDFQFKIDNQVIDLGKELYLNPEINFEFQNFEMSDDRKVAYEFSDKYLIESTTKIQLPKTASIEYLPESVDIQHEKFAFQLSYKQYDNIIIYTRQLEIKNPLIEVNDFESWNVAIQQLKTFYEDQIIIIK